MRQAYVDWVRRSIHVHPLRHPRELGAREVTAYLNQLACGEGVPEAAWGEARWALLCRSEGVFHSRPGNG